MRAKSGNLDQTNVRQHRKRDSSRKIGNSYQSGRGRQELEIVAKGLCMSQKEIDPGSQVDGS